MTHTDAELSDAKRALLAKYLRGDIPKPLPTALPTALPDTTGANGRPLQGAAPSPAPASDTSRAPTIAIQASGGKVPFFFPHVHWQGGASYCFTLAHGLGPDQPFYLVEPYRLADLQTPPTLEDIAAECVTSVRAIQPQGPYRLGGYCGAGFILFEMAQQLQAAGQRVEKLVMIEPGVGPYYAPLLGWIGNLIRRTGAALRRTPDQQLSWFLYLRHVYKLARYPAYRQALQSSPARSLARSLVRSLTPTRASLREDWLGAFVWIVSTYVPRPYCGTVTYIWARDDAGSQRDWWRRRFVAQEMENYYTAGNRSNCRGTYAHDLAVQLRACLGDR
jgi:hypothetical protein